MKVRAHLAWMAAAILVPVVVLSAIALGMLLNAERAAARRGVLETARVVALAVDQELATAESALRVLASSAYLASSDLSSFYQQARNARTTAESWILLFDPDGEQLLNTRFPFGSTLAKSLHPERIRGVIEAGKAAVSNLYPGAITKRLVVTVDVPVPLDGRNRYVLSQAFFPEYFNRLFAERGAPPDWIIGIFDRNHLTIARSHRADEFVGKPGAVILRDVVQNAAEGAIRHVSREGIDIYDVFTRSARSGWVVAIGVPVQSLEATARRAVLVAALGLLGALGIATGVAFLIARRLTSSIAEAAQSAVALGRGEKPPRHTSSVDEIDRVHAALAEASANLSREKEGRARAEIERARLLANEQAARELAEAENRAKDEFLAMLGHELRNPLSAISGAASVLETRGTGDEASHARAVIARQTQHLSRIVDDLLDLSRVMTGKIVLDCEPVDLADALRRCVSTLRAAGRIERHTVTVQGEPAWISADATRLDQIIMNILVNALKYTPEGGRIDIEAKTERGEAVLTVSDSGIGISERLLPQIFDVFVQGDASLDRARGGLGLGLALVRRLATLHGGSASAVSAGPGRGSTFTVRFPRIAAPDTRKSAVAASTPKPDGRRRVLIVDDHEDSRSMLSLMLKLSGYEPLEARDGIEGVRVAIAEKPDVAIVDIGLPGIDGYEVARRLRADPATRLLPLIALTGYGQDEDRRRALEAGFDLHLVKPVEAEQIEQAIATAARPQSQS